MKKDNPGLISIKGDNSRELVFAHDGNIHELLLVVLVEYVALVFYKSQLNVF